MLVFQYSWFSSFDDFNAATLNYNEVCLNYLIFILQNVEDMKENLTIMLIIRLLLDDQRKLAIASYLGITKTKCSCVCVGVICGDKTRKSI